MLFPECKRTARKKQSLALFSQSQAIGRKENHPPGDVFRWLFCLTAARTAPPNTAFPTEKRPDQPTPHHCDASGDNNKHQKMLDKQAHERSGFRPPNGWRNFLSFHVNRKPIWYVTRAAPYASAFM